MPSMKESPQWLALRERIFAAPWHEWGHAYGSAADVPPLLEALAVGSNEEREKACWELYGNVFHQGTRWHASPRAVPFLLEMLALREPPLPDRAWLIEYLLSLALGYEEEFLPSGLDPDEYFEGVEDEVDEELDPDEDDPFSSAEMMRFGVFARDTYRAVEAGCDLFLALLGDEEPAVRQEAAHALAWFPSRAHDVARALSERWEQMEEGERANALLAMSLQGRWIEPAERAPWAERAARSLEAPLLAERLAAAVALANWGGERVGEALQVLAEAVARGEELREWQHKRRETHGAALQWHSTNLQSLAASCLARAPEPERGAAMAALQDALPGSPMMTNLSLSGALLALAFPPGEDGEREQVQRGTLSPEQERALRAITEHGAWGSDGGVFVNYSSLLRGFGLPDSPEKLRAWLDRK